MVLVFVSYGISISHITKWMVKIVRNKKSDLHLLIKKTDCCWRK